MCDPSMILRLFEKVLNESLDENNVKAEDVRVGIRNMIEFYKPKPKALASESSQVANYNDDAHRCAYLHKYAPFHTVLVSEMLNWALASNFILPYLLQTNSGLKLCCLGGGPGSDVIGILAALHSKVGFFRCSVTVVDIIPSWIYTFTSLIQELRSGGYGTLGDCFSLKYFDWSYLRADLLGKMDNQVNKAVGSATIVTMVKFISAAACKDTAAMISKIFRTMRPGALVFYIDNAGGGFYQLVHKAAMENNFVSIFGPLKHRHYRNEAFKTKRFGYTSCFESIVTVQILMKPMNLKIARDIPDNLNASPTNPAGRNIHTPVKNYNQLRPLDDLEERYVPPQLRTQNSGNTNYETLHWAARKSVEQQKTFINSKILTTTLNANSSAIVCLSSFVLQSSSNSITYAKQTGIQPNTSLQSSGYTCRNHSAGSTENRLPSISQPSKNANDENIFSHEMQSGSQINSLLQSGSQINSLLQSCSNKNFNLNHSIRPKANHQSMRSNDRQRTSVSPATPVGSKSNLFLPSSMILDSDQHSHAIESRLPSFLQSPGDHGWQCNSNVKGKATRNDAFPVHAQTSAGSISHFTMPKTQESRPVLYHTKPVITHYDQYTSAMPAEDTSCVWKSSDNKPCHAATILESSNNSYFDPLTRSMENQSPFTQETPNYADYSNGQISIREGHLSSELQSSYKEDYQQQIDNDEAKVCCGCCVIS